jgi:hypothetical protein
MVDLLSPLVSPGFRRVIAAQLQLIRGVDAALIASIDPAAPQKPAATPQPREIDGFIRETANKISQTETLADGTTVKDLFNFLVCEKQTIVVTPGCSTPGVSITPFRQLEDGVVEKMEKIRAALEEKEKLPVIRSTTRLRMA